MKRAITALVSMLVVLSTTVWMAGAADEQPIAHLETYHATTDVVHRGLAVVLAPKLPLYSGDIVQTRKGEAVVAFTDGTKLRLKPRTRIEVTETSERRSVDVLFGRLWSFIARRQDKATGFKTGGTIAAVRGTKIEYAANADGSVDVGVIEGSLTVTWTNADGTTGSVTLGPGERLHIPPSGAPGPAVPFSPGDIADSQTADVGPDETQEIHTKLIRVTARGGNDPFSPSDPASPGEGSFTPTPTPTPTPGATPVPTATPTLTPTPTPITTPPPGSNPPPTPTRTAVHSPTPHPTATATPTATVTPHPTRPTSPTPRPSGTFPTGSQPGGSSLGSLDFRGTYEGSFRPRRDPGDVESKLRLAAGPIMLQVRMNGRSVTLTGPAPFIPVSGNLDGRSVLLMGTGTASGQSGVRAEFVGQFVPTTRGARLMGNYIFGLGGTLPGGHTVSYSFDGRQ